MKIKKYKFIKLLGLTSVLGVLVTTSIIFTSCSSTKNDKIAKFDTNNINVDKLELEPQYMGENFQSWVDQFETLDKMLIALNKEQTDLAKFSNVTILTTTSKQESNTATIEVKLVPNQGFTWQNEDTSAKILTITIGKIIIKDSISRKDNLNIEKLFLNLENVISNESFKLWVETHKTLEELFNALNIKNEQVNFKNVDFTVSSANFVEIQNNPNGGKIVLKLSPKDGYTWIDNNNFDTLTINISMILINGTNGNPK